MPASPRILTIGLTGGIASGKTMVARQLAEMGATVIDADQVSRDLVEPGQPALNEIVQRFGESILQPDGGLDRSRLREIVFEDDAARRDLESILHPRIRQELSRRRDAAEGRYCVLVIPILIKTGMPDLVDRILVVDAPREVQLQRLIRRDDISQSLAEKMIDAQAPREERLAIADDILENNGTREALGDFAAALDAGYERLARGEVDHLPPMHFPG